jgi:hypothetical protein
MPMGITTRRSVRGSYLRPCRSGGALAMYHLSPADWCSAWHPQTHPWYMICSMYLALSGLTYTFVGFHALLPHRYNPPLPHLGRLKVFGEQPREVLRRKKYEYATPGVGRLHQLTVYNFARCKRDQWHPRRPHPARANHAIPVALQVVQCIRRRPRFSKI